jgi:glycogen debranching enzyme
LLAARPQKVYNLLSFARSANASGCSIGVCLVLHSGSELAPVGPGDGRSARHSCILVQRHSSIENCAGSGARKTFQRGWQDGSFEAWIFPWKIFSDLRLTVEMKDYPVPIEVNEHAAVIEVRPDHTIITFAHSNFTIREVLFAPEHATDGVGVIAFFQIEAVRPMTVTVQFTPEMKRMWPAPSEDYISADWVKTATGGFYALHGDSPDHAAAAEMPGAEPGILPPYQERAKFYPAQFVLHFDPTHDSDKLFPLLLTVADTATDARDPSLAAKLVELGRAMPSLYQDTASYYRDFLSHHLAVHTPDQDFNDAFAWAEVAMDQLRVETIPAHDETALVAGVDASADSVRPGFGWFFGRDALWSLYAVNSYGDFELARDELEFLLKRQSPQGEIMHEWSQTAGLVDWQSLPYEYASADATPLLLMAANDYLETSGDVSFLSQHWAEFQKAWTFECSHDSDHDGIYENTIGTGWVESWPPGMPHQEIYLAALDQQASTAFANIARATGHRETGEEASKRAASIAQQIEKEYFLTDAGFYAFSRNANGTLDASPTIYPSVADWDGTFHLSHTSGMLNRWASQEFSTDWGTRDLSPTVSFYDPISYHQGSVWPLFTGWVSLSEYRNGRSLSGYAHLMQNADLTWAQDLGAVTELLSGEFFRWFGRSTSHQLWSSAMVISPALRGLFGLEWNAADRVLSVTPHLPATWADASLSDIPLGPEHFGLSMRRSGTNLIVRLAEVKPESVHLISHAAGAKIDRGVLEIRLPAVEVSLAHGLPEAGATTAQLKVLDQQESVRSLKLRLSAPAKSKQSLFVRVNDASIHLRVEGGQLSPDSSHLEMVFPSGNGYTETTVTLAW